MLLINTTDSLPPLPIDVEAMRPLRIDNYRILDRLGAGGMGEVYRARPIDADDPHASDEVAIKIGRARPQTGPHNRSALERSAFEFDCLSRLNHPAIVKPIANGISNSGLPYIVMERVEAIGQLNDPQFINQPNDGWIHLFLELCDAVEHVHRRGLVHRDLTPANVLVTQQPSRFSIKLIDFGAAETTSEHDIAYDVRRSLLGTFHYMSPEQADLQSSRIDNRSDIFSLGVVLFECLTLTTPLESALTRDTSRRECLDIVRNQKPMHPSTRRRSQSSLTHQLPTNTLLDEVCYKAMARCPKDRYSSAAAFAAAIRSCFPRKISYS